MKRKYLTKNFLLLCQGTFFTSIGSVLYSVAIGIWVFNETGSTSLMGYVSSITYIISLLFSSLAGVLTDRMNEKGILVVTDAIRGITMLCIGLLASFDLLNVSHVIITAIISATCQLFFSPASTLVFTKIVSKEDFLQANSLFKGVDSLIRAIGNGISGFLVINFGFSSMILFNGVSLIISAITEMFIKIPKKEKDKITSLNNILSDLKEGFCYVYNDKILFKFIVVAGVLNLICAGYYGVIYPWCIAKGFTVEQYGLFLGVGSFASILAMLYLSLTQIPKEKYYKAFINCIVIFVVFNIFTMILSNFYIVSFMSLITGFSNMIFNMILNSVLFYMIEENHRGKVLGILTSVSQGATGLSMIIYGNLSEVISVTTVSLYGAIILVIPLLLICFDDTIKLLLESK